MDDAQDILLSFKLVCRKCQSEDVGLSRVEGTDYGGDTGYEAGTLAVGCNACKQNDLFIYI